MAHFQPGTIVHLAPNQVHLISHVWLGIGGYSLQVLPSNEPQEPGQERVKLAVLNPANNEPFNFVTLSIPAAELVLGPAPQ